MDLAKWKVTLMAALAWAGLAWGQAGPAPSPPLGIGRDLVTVRESGRPDQKCRILKAWKLPDGTMGLEVQCLETEEHLTIVEMASAEGGLTDSAKGMKSRIYHWGQSTTPPAGVPQPSTSPARSPEIEVSDKPDAISMSQAPRVPPAAPAPDTSAGPDLAASKSPQPLYPLPPEAKRVPIQIETAKPSNWHESWGKADDHHTNLTPEKITDASPPKSEPQAVPTSPPIKVEEPPVSEQLPDISQMTEKVNSISEAAQPAGYSHIDDRPGIAHVTDIPPDGEKVTSESKKPIMDFLRTLWKPTLKDPAPLKTIQVAEMPAPAPVPNPHQYQKVLEESLLPSEREMAAEALSGFPQQQDPTIVPALLHGAAEDPAATVRAACIHGLVKMNANSSEVVGVLMNLKADPDLRVRREVHQALISFGLAKPEPENEMIHQISAPDGKTGEW